MLKIVSAEFIKGAITSKQFPQTGVPEFAFFGRSNAGKSSLINMLLNRKNLVKTGSKPGMTREINFFIVNAPAKNGTARNNAGGTPQKNDTLKVFSLADLPGYGFSQVSQAERKRIDTMLYDYCTTRPELKTMFFLMDIRRDPTAVERQTLVFFQEQGINTVLTATKADKLSKNEQIQRITALASFFDCGKDTIVATSSTKKTGREKLLQLLSACLTH